MSVNVVEIDVRDLSVTPFFDIRSLENVQKSEAAGQLVKEQVEVVEVRIAGSQGKFSPVFPTNAMWKRDGNRIITYAERWPEEYRRFKEGEPQEVRGTPLELLGRFGITPEQLSICRALRIYSIEQLHQLEGPNLKSLGMQQNHLKKAAADFMAERYSGADAAKRIAELEAQIAAMQAKSTAIPVQDSTPAEIAAALSAADSYDAMPGRALYEMLIERTGITPAEKPTKAQMISMLRELDKGAAA